MGKFAATRPQPKLHNRCFGSPWRKCLMVLRNHPDGCTTSAFREATPPNTFKSNLVSAVRG